MNVVWEGVVVVAEWVRTKSRHQPQRSIKLPIEAGLCTATFDVFAVCQSSCMATSPERLTG
jgi:hypothetical protein